MNNIGLMLESGFDEKMSDPEQALEFYKKAHKLGNTDATINLALFHLNVSD
jgi:TPR repeat protein